MAVPKPKEENNDANSFVLCRWLFHQYVDAKYGQGG